jgi:replication factor A1
MKISELQPKQGKIDIEVEVVKIDEPREFEKFGQKGKVTNATVKDDSGEIKMTLWNDEIDQVKEGGKIKITNGYVNEYQGEKQLTAGRFGKLETVEE